MKTIFLSIVVVFTYMSITAQNYYEISFEGTGLYEFDTRHELVVEPGGLWQVGSPNKTVFTEAYTFPNAIVTDTANTYPINANSSFMIKHVANLGFDMPSVVSLGGEYLVNSDSLTDYGMIEFSPDNGVTWVDLIHQGQYDALINWGNDASNDAEIPVLTGNSNGWKHFEVNIQNLTTVFPINSGDTVLFKYSFISDGIDNNRDGLMFDSLYMWDVPPIGLNEQKSENSLMIYPNPVSSTLTLDFSNDLNNETVLKVYNHLGVKVDELVLTEQGTMMVDIARYANGLYYIELSDILGNRLRSGAFVKQAN